MRLRFYTSCVIVKTFPVHILCDSRFISCVHPVLKNIYVSFVYTAERSVRFSSLFNMNDLTLVFYCQQLIELHQECDTIRNRLLRMITSVRDDIYDKVKADVFPRNADIEEFFAFAYQPDPREYYDASKKIWVSQEPPGWRKSFHDLARKGDCTRRCPFAERTSNAQADQSVPDSV